ncbi:hypothetical protein RFM26_00690 [Mesorhizobium sp. VK23B]|uniref:TIGR04255 family protein n=1 Tax=Mesorhizobium dulcispinae TaxID=3072316 RepID=A0ABU4X715_9HYPH|nr:MULTISPECIES: hypothetical protein [unclassified Mesorhizobium]MDX8464210.1 hypothetical protein [Mesorhizobium sp. VK23B]MDX8470596.1 hypothetical protein [Mesorhizobium sp. VK23A]
MEALSSFELNNYAFEIRYPNAYRIWDEAGRIAIQLQEGVKNLELTKGEPSLLAFVLNNSTTVEVRIDRLNVTEHYPKSDFSKDTRDLQYVFDVVADNIRITDITRLGTKVEYRKDFKSKSELSHFFENFKVVSAVAGKNFNVASELVFPTIHLQAEDKELGYHFRITPKNERVQLSVGPGVTDIQAVDKEKIYVSLEVDLYTVKETDRSSLRVSDWIDTVARVVRRDVDKILSKLSE